MADLDVRKARTYVTSLLKKNKALTDREIKAALAKEFRLRPGKVGGKVILEVRREMGIDGSTPLTSVKSMLGMDPLLQAKKVMGEVADRIGIRSWAPAAAELFAPRSAGAGDTSRAPVTSHVKDLEMSPEEIRIRVRALIRPTLGAVEEAADRILAEARDRKLRRSIVHWKIEATTTLLAAMLRPDPILALADAWGYALQLEGFLNTPQAKETFGGFLPVAALALTDIQSAFREFAGSLQGLDVAGSEARVRQWAKKNPISGRLYRRQAIDSAVAAVLAGVDRGGALAALKGLPETTADVTMRMDLYTMYLPRLGRWEAELAVDDIAGEVDPAEMAVEFGRLTQAIDRIAVVSETGSELAARERAAAVESLHGERIAAMQDLRAERIAVLEGIHEERIATLQELEAIACRLADAFSGSLRSAVSTEREELLKGVEAVRVATLQELEAVACRLADASSESIRSAVSAEREELLKWVEAVRVATLQELEAIACRLAEASSGSLRSAVSAEREELLRGVEAVRVRTFDDSASLVKAMIDRAFVRAIGLLLIAAALGAIGLVLYASFLRH